MCLATVTHGGPIILPLPVVCLAFNVAQPKEKEAPPPGGVLQEEGEGGKGCWPWWHRAGVQVHDSKWRGLDT